MKKHLVYGYVFIHCLAYSVLIFASRVFSGYYKSLFGEKCQTILHDNWITNPFVLGAFAVLALPSCYLLFKSCKRAGITTILFWIVLLVNCSIVLVIGVKLLRPLFCITWYMS